jgi:arginine decarboxylase
VVPRLGVRARLASQGSGKWQSSGGEKSKFGLAANQVLQLVEILRERGRLDSIQLLHFHLGSQMANIRDIATGVRESARFYVDCTSWVSTFSASTWAAAWAWTMKARARSLTAP